jgi:hypothetical protein
VRVLLGNREHSNISDGFSATPADAEKIASQIGPAPARNEI